MACTAQAAHTIMYYAVNPAVGWFRGDVSKAPPPVVSSVYIG